MKRFFRVFERKRKIRKLEVTRAGKGFIALTIGVGVVALASGNNSIYLIESLLLSGLILSGIVSERQLSTVRVDFILNQAKATENTQDWILLHNPGKTPVFCIEVGEWVDGAFHSVAFFPKIDAGETARSRSNRILTVRGNHRWEGFAIATEYPFGFARKIKIVRRPGERIVWPKDLSSKRSEEKRLSGDHFGRSAETEIVDGEIRPYDWSDDARLIVANRSALGMEPMVRNRKPSPEKEETVFDLREMDPEVFERGIERAAAALYRFDRVELVLIDHRGKKRISEKRLALNTLATSHPENPKSERWKSSPHELKG
jgi:uncharacterized protein (DUF58 family)